MVKIFDKNLKIFGFDNATIFAVDKLKGWQQGDSMFGGNLQEIHLKFGYSFFDTSNTVNASMTLKVLDMLLLNNYSNLIS